MPFSLRVRAPLLYATWRGFTTAELDDIVARTSALRRESGAPVVYVARLPAGGRVFDETEHEALTQFLATMVLRCSAIHHIIEGDGFVKSARWASVTNMANASGKPSVFYKHATIAEATSVIRATCGADFEAVIRSEPVVRSGPKDTRLP